MHYIYADVPKVPFLGSYAEAVGLRLRDVTLVAGVARPNRLVDAIQVVPLHLPGGDRCRLERPGRLKSHLGPELRCAAQPKRLRASRGQDGEGRPRRS